MNQKFYELAKKIADWHEKTFPDADKTGQLLKLDEEFDEWGNADPYKELEELADCFIVAAALRYRYNAFIGLFTMRAIVRRMEDVEGELYDAIVAKMEVNKERTRRGDWKKQANGSYHH